MSDSSAGPLLEARAQRLFLAQGSFAERGLLPTATADRRMLATDIDVLVSEYIQRLSPDTPARRMQVRKVRATRSYIVA